MKWNKILLVRANFRTFGYDFSNSPFPPLALEYIAAYAEDLAEVKIIDAKLENLSLREFKQRLVDFKPDIVGFTVTVTSAIVSVLKHAKIAKQLGCTTVIGGWHPSLAPDETLASPWIDFLVRGEGEFTFRELLEKGTPENILGLSYKKDGKLFHNPERPFCWKLDELRFPARHLTAHYRYEILNGTFDAIETSRGCPQRCKFCSTHVVYKGKWRPRTVPNVIKEIEAVSSNKKIDDVFLVDDNILVDMRRMGKLCIEIIRGKCGGRIRKNLHFFFQGRLDSMIRHPSIFKLLKMAGFWLVIVGIEATDNKTLLKIQKGCTLDVFSRGLKILHDNDILALGNVIIGVNLDNTVEDELVNIKRTGEFDVDLQSFTLLTPFPSTGFHDEMKQKGLLLTEDYSQYNWLTPVIKTNILTPAQLRTLLFLGYKHIGYYAGRMRGKFRLLRRIIRTRGIKYILSPMRAWGGAKAYLSWRRMVEDHLTHIPHKMRDQLLLGSVKQMQQLRDAVTASK